MKQLSSRNPTHDDLELFIALILEEAGFEGIDFNHQINREDGRPLGDVDVIAYSKGKVYGFEIKSNDGRLDRGCKRNKFYRHVENAEHFFSVYPYGKATYLVHQPKDKKEFPFLDLVRGKNKKGHYHIGELEEKLEAA